MRLEAPGTPAREPADISAWLGTLKKVLRLPESEASGILEELEDHLQQRARDLQIAGHGDAEAVRLALNELGDAALLARRFRSATGYRRRRLAMNLAVLGLASGAAVVSTIAVSRGPAAQPEAPRTGVQNAYMDLRGWAWQPEQRLTFVQSDPVNLGDLLERVAKSLELPLHVRWERLEQASLPRDTSVIVVGKDLDVGEVFRRINEGESFQRTKLDYRADHGVLEIADREFFDRRERTLASYDIAGLVGAAEGDARNKIVEELAKTITQFASPEDWRDNGGDLGALSIVGPKMFVEAPPRMHRQVRWILDQLKAEAAQKPQSGAGQTRMERYALAHIDAPSALRMLGELQGIREIDFSKFTADSMTNTLIGIGDAAVHDRVAGALAVLDRPSQVQAQSVPILGDLPIIGHMYQRP